MKTVRLMMVLALLASGGSAFGSAKKKFIEAVKSQCGKSEGDAKSMATPGRTGTVVQFKLCVSSPIDAGGGCNVKCSKAGSTIGG